MRQPGLILRAADEAAMQSIGRILAASLPAGTAELLLTLQGELGAGKTTLARALLRGLGVGGAVKSPTYTLVEPYETGSGRLLHFDLYRLASPDELEWLGYRDLREGSRLALVEWPEQAAGHLGTADISTQIEYDGAGRLLTLRAGSAAGERWLEALATQAAAFAPAAAGE